MKMTNPSDDDESYLVPNSDVQNEKEEKVWCKIGDNGELEIVEWSLVEGIANEYDRTDPSKRNDKMLIAKLMWLTRQITLKECGK
jgi:hypothetical protein